MAVPSILPFDGARYMFVGASATDHHRWPAYFAAYFALRYPQYTLHFAMDADSGTNITRMFGNDEFGLNTESPISSYHVHYRTVQPWGADFIFIQHAESGGFASSVDADHRQTYIEDYCNPDSITPILINGWQSTAPYPASGTSLSEETAINARAIANDWNSSTIYSLTNAKWGTEFTYHADAGTDTLTVSGHPFTDGMRVRVNDYTGTHAAPLADAPNDYYVRDISGDSFKLSLTQGGSVLNLTSSVTSDDPRISRQWALINGHDSVHPGAPGYMALFKYMMDSLGMDTSVSQATINANAATVTSQTQCAISSISRNRYGGIDFNRLDNRLPYVLDDDWWDDAVELEPDLLTHQDYSMTVTGLPAGIYEILCGGVTLGTATHAQLANGWNMAALQVGPVFDKGKEVLGRIRDAQGRARSSSAEQADLPFAVASPPYSGFEKYKNLAATSYNVTGNRGSAHVAALAAQKAVLDALDDAINAEAQPETLAFSIRLTGWTPPIGIPDCAWGALHPITEPRPAQPGAWPSAAATGYFYVDNTHGSATDNDGVPNTYGYPNKPRLTIPEITYPAGSYVEIHGGPYRRTSGDEEHDFVFTGTEANPCWIVAHDSTNKPELQGGFEVSGTYAIFDGILFTRDIDPDIDRGPAVSVGGDASAGTSYICLRNCEADGDEVEISPSTGSTCMGTSGSIGDETHHIVFYNCNVHDYGNMLYTQTVAYSDDHAFRPGQYSNNVWIVDCVATACAGDAVQITGNNAIGDERAHHVYIGRNEFHYTGENAIDVKSSVDVIISQNQFYNFPGGLGGAGTAVVVQTESGSGCDNVWVLLNKIYDCKESMRVEEVATNVYFIGNIAHTMYDSDPLPPSPEDGYSGIRARANSSGSLTAIDNTIVGGATGMLFWKAVGSSPNVDYRGNILSGRTNPSGWDIWAVGTIGVGQIIDRNAYDSATPRFYHTATYTDITAWRSAKGWDANSAVGDTDLIDPDNDDYGIGSASVARGINTEHAAYAAFESRYGLDIRYDFYGNARPASGAWDAGALQYGSVRSLEAPEETPTAPINVTPPSITGTPIQGTQVTSSAGSWSGAVSYAYQWTRTTGSVVVGTSINYTPVLADVGSTLTFRVTATNATGSTALTTAASAPVEAADVPPPSSSSTGKRSHSHVSRIIAAIT